MCHSNKNKELSKVVFKNDEIELEEDIQEILDINPEYEVYNVMNALFKKTYLRGIFIRFLKLLKCVLS